MQKSQTCLVFINNVDGAWQGWLTAHVAPRDGSIHPRDTAVLACINADIANQSPLLVGDWKNAMMQWFDDQVPANVDVSFSNDIPHNLILNLTEPAVFTKGD